MITKHISEVTTRFNPFTRPAKTCRLFLASLPANARQNMKITAKVLGKDSTEPSSLKLKFKDGKEMALDTEKLAFGDLVQEVDRHSRVLSRLEELS